MKVAAVLLGLVGLALAAPARADGPVPPLALNTYDVAPGCPDAAAFRAEIRRHTHGMTAPIQVKVWIQPGFDGTLEVVDMEGARSTQNLTSASCGEVVNAFALAVALAVAKAVASPPPAARPPPPPPPPEMLPAIPPPSPPSPETHAPPHARPIAVLAGADGAGIFGATPNPVVGLPVFVEVAQERDRAGLVVEPRARLAWTFAATSDAPGGTVHWTSGALDLCPLRYAFVTHTDRAIADVRACARLEVGILSATTAKTDRALWLAAGAPLTFRVEPARSLFVELEGAVRAPLARDRFAAGPANSFVFRPSAVGGDVAIGAGVIFR